MRRQNHRREMSLFLVIIVVGIFFAATCDATAQQLSTKLRSPAGLWPSEFASMGLPMPTLGIRSVLARPTSLLHNRYRVRNLLTSASAALDGTLVQARVSAASTSQWSPLMFAASVSSATANCSKVWYAFNATHIANSNATSVSSTPMFMLTGGFVTCDWAVYDTMHFSGTNMRVGQLFDFRLPSAYQATSFFDVFVWQKFNSGIPTVGFTQYTYILMNEYDNVTGEGGGGIESSLSSYDTGAFTVNPTVKTTLLSFPGNQTSFRNASYVEVVAQSSSAPGYDSGVARQYGVEPPRPLPISAATAWNLSSISQVLCVEEDITSYVVETIPAGSQVTPYSFFGYQQFVRLFYSCLDPLRNTSVAAVMDLCNADLDCVGFFTYMAPDYSQERTGCTIHWHQISSPKEEGVAYAAEATVAYPRLVHWKRHLNAILDRNTFADPFVSGCRVNATDTLTMNVSIAVADVEAAVFVNGALVDYCIPDADAPCDSLFTCVLSAPLQPASIVRVVPTAISASRRCPLSYFKVLFAADNVSTPVELAPLDGADGNITSNLTAMTTEFTSLRMNSYFGKSVHVPYGTPRVYLANMLTVYGRAELFIRQTAFYGSSSGPPSMVFTAVPMSGSSDQRTYVSHCGGAGGFYYGLSANMSAPGYSNRCDVWLRCETLMDTDHTRIFTGTFTLDIDWTKINVSSQIWSCDGAPSQPASHGIDVDLYVSNGVGSGGPIVESGFTYLHPLLLVPASVLTLSQMYAKYTTKYALIDVFTRINSTFPFGTVYMYLMKKTEFPLNGSNVFTCIVDSFPSSSVACEFPIVNATQHISFAVEDINLVSSHVQWAIVANGTTVRSGFCGGSYGYADGSAPSASNCGVYKPCLITRVDSLSKNSLYPYITKLIVSVPSSVGGSGLSCGLGVFTALVNCSTTIPNATQVELEKAARILRSPALLWPADVRATLLGSRSIVSGFRSVLPAPLAHPHSSYRARSIFKPAVTVLPNLLVQARVTTTNASDWSPDLFSADSWNPSPKTNCTSLMAIDQYASFVSVEPSTLAAWQRESLASGLATCNWSWGYSYSSVEGPKMNAAAVFDFALPTSFDANAFFDVFVYVENADPPNIPSQRISFSQSTYILLAYYNSTGGGGINAVYSSYSTSTFSSLPARNVTFGYGSEARQASYRAVASWQWDPPGLGYDAGATRSYGAAPPAPYAISHTTRTDLTAFSHVVCTVDELTAYEVELIPPNAYLTPYAFYGNQFPSLYISCQDPLKYSTVADVMDLCNSDMDCMGFTTYMSADYSREEVGCMLHAHENLIPRERSAWSERFSYPRLVHWKRHLNGFLDRNTHADPFVSGCRVNATDALTMNASIAVADVEAAVFVDGALVDYCIPDADAPCDSLFTCVTSAPLQPASIVRVVPTAISATRRCPLPYFKVLFAADNVSTPVELATLDGADGNITADLDLMATSAKALRQFSYLVKSVRIPYGTPRAVLAFVSSIRYKLDIAVRQTVFDVSSLTPSPVLTTTAIPSALSADQRNYSASCGGPAGFYYGSSNTSVPGYSNRCDLWLKCGQVRNANELFSGVIIMEIDWTHVNVSKQVWSCDEQPSTRVSSRGLDVEVMISNVVGQWGLFAQEGYTYVLPLLVSENVTSGAGRQLIGYFPAIEDMHPYGSLHLLTFSYAQLKLNGSEVLACSIDSFLSDTIACEFPIVNATQHISFAVEDINLVSSHVQWAIVANGTTVRSGFCGGSYGYADGSAPSASNCGVYKPCLITPVDTLSKNSSYPYITKLLVSVPQAVATSGLYCGLGVFTALVNYSTTIPPNHTQPTETVSLVQTTTEERDATTTVVDIQSATETRRDATTTAVVDSMSITQIRSLLRSASINVSTSISVTEPKYNESTTHTVALPPPTDAPTTLAPPSPAPQSPIRLFTPVSATDMRLARLTGLPAGLWDRSYAALPASVGVRTALYQKNALSLLSTPHILRPNVTSSMSRVLLVQYRVTTADTSRWDPKMFAVSTTFGQSVNGTTLSQTRRVSCSSLLMVNNNTVQAAEPLEAPPSVLALQAGGFVTCNWSSYPVTNLGGINQEKTVAFDFTVPTAYDAASAFDVIVWVDRVGDHSPLPPPQSSYVLWAPYTTSGSGSSVGGIEASLSNYSTGSFWVNPNVTAFSVVDRSGQTRRGSLVEVVPSIGPGSISGAESLDPLATVPPLSIASVTAVNLSTISAISCFVADVASYLVERFAANTSVTTSYVFGQHVGSVSRSVPPRSHSATTVADMMRMCDQDFLCVGFETFVSNSTLTETTGAFFRLWGVDHPTASERDSPADGAVGSRLVHWKRSGAIHASIAATSGCRVRNPDNQTLNISVAASNAEAAVFVDGVLLDYCVPPATVPCGAFYTCASVALNHSSVVRVVHTATTPTQRCAASYLRVLFTAGPRTAPAPARPRGIEGAASSSLLTASAVESISSEWRAARTAHPRSVFRSIHIPYGAPVAYVNVVNLWPIGQSASLYVAQSAFGGVNGSTAPLMTITTTNLHTGQQNMSYCGGSAGFVGAAGATVTPGFSNRCDLRMRCPTAVVSPSAGAFSGFLGIEVNWSLLDAVGVVTACEPREAVTVANRRYGVSLDVVVPYAATPSVAGFLGIQRAGDTTLYPSLLTPTWVAPPNGTASLVGPFTPIVGRFDTFGALQLWAINTTTFVLGGAEMLVCMVDSFRTDQITCTFPLPSRAVRVQLLLHDINLVNSAVAWSIVVGGSVVRSGNCGGAFRYEGGVAPDGSSCYRYRSCLTTFIDDVPRNDAHPYTASLLVTVPSTVAAAGTLCGPAVFTALVNYSAVVPPSTASCLGYVCPSDRRCVGLDALCNGARDCADATDETQCLSWFDVELGSLLSLPIVLNSTQISAVTYVFNTFTTLSNGSLAGGTLPPSVAAALPPSFDMAHPGPWGSLVFPAGFTVRSVADCRALATRSKSSAFAFDSRGLECIVYNFTSQQPATPFDFSGVIITAPSFRVYTTLTSRLQYSTCSNRHSCASNGQASRLVTGTCGCVCDSLFRGETCEQYQDLSADFSEIFFLFPIPQANNSNSGFSTTAVESALRVWMPSGSFACKAPLRVDATQVSVICTDSNGVLTADLINNASSLASFNAALMLFSPVDLQATAISPTSIPRFESLNVCQLGNQSTVLACELPGPIVIDSLAVSTTPSSSGIDTDSVGLVVNVTFVDTARRRSGSPRRTVQVTCPPEATSVSTSPGGFATLTCLLDVTSISIDQAVASYRILVVDVSGEALPLANSGLFAPKSFWKRALLVPPLFTPENPSTIEESFTVFMAFGAALIALGAVLLLVIAALVYINRRFIARVLSRTHQDASLSTLQKVVETLFIRVTKVEFVDVYSSESDDGEEVVDADGRVVRDADPDHRLEHGDGGMQLLRKLCARRVRKSDTSFFCASFWVCIWLVGVLLILWFVTSSGVTSDTWVVVERYSENTCQRSQLSPTPSAVFFVPDSSATECKRRHVAGRTTVNFYFSGWCYKNASGSNVVAKFRTGASEADCNAETFHEVASDDCLPSATIWGTPSDTTYTRIVCGSTSSTIDRFGYLLTLSDRIEPNIAASVVATAAAQISPGAAGLESRAETVGLRSATGAFQVPTAAAATFDVISEGGTLFATRGAELAFQVEDEVFLDPSADPNTTQKSRAIDVIADELVDAFFSNLSAPVPDGAYETVTSSPNISRYLFASEYPQLPMGKLYGDYNLQTETSGSAAGPTATRYYTGQYSLVDVGAYIDVDTMEEGDGFTISFLSKASRHTYGFVFALTDGVEDLSTGSSPILDAMFNLLRTNAGPEYWFTSDYHIYNSFFIDGPANLVYFIYAAPSQQFGKQVSTTANQTVGKTLAVLTWDLDQLHLRHLLNGLWHSVELVLRMENNLIKVQLIVDGETSRSALGWNQCLNDRLPQVVPFPEAQSVLVFNTSQQVRSSPILWTGYLNGGVARVVFGPKVPDLFDVWKSSTPAIRERNRIPVTGYRVLAALMIVAAAGLFCFMALQSGRELWEEAERSDRELVRSMYTRYMTLLAACPPDASGAYYAPLKYVTAKRWLGLSDRQVGQFLDEQAQGTAKVSEELIRMLYLSGVAQKQDTEKNIHTLMPTAAEWEDLIADDEQRYVSDHKGTWFWSSTSAEEEPLADVDLSQLFRRRSTMRASKLAVPAAPLPTSEDPASVTVESTTTVVVDVVATSDNDNSQARALQLALKTRSTTRKKEAGGVNTSNLKFKSAGGGGNLHANTSSRGGGGGGGLNLGAELKQLFFPILSVIQTVYLWITSSQFVSTYLTYFSNFFSFVSIDWVTSFQLPTLVTPLVQLFVGLVAFLVLLYLTAMDEIRFSWYVARYVLKRDAMELTAASDVSLSVTAVNYCNAIIARFPNPFGKVAQCPRKFDLEILPVSEAMKIDRFVGVSAVKSDDDEDAKPAAATINEMLFGPVHPPGHAITVHDSRQREFSLLRNEAAAKLDALGQAAALEVSCPSDSNAETRPLEVVGVCCRHHNRRRLSPQAQTDVWPFLYAPSCCVVVNGVRCDCSTGIIYSCQHEESINGVPSLCDFAVCERHYRGGVVDGIVADLLATVRTGQQRGSMWVLSTIVMLVSNAAYMPFVKTAIMIMACHPMFQCEFTECHNFEDQKYLIAFYLSLCVVVLFGFGLPFMQVLQLRRRRLLLLHVFFSPEYRDRYMQRDTDIDKASMINQFQTGGTSVAALEASLKQISRDRPARKNQRKNSSKANQELKATPVTVGEGNPLATTAVESLGGPGFDHACSPVVDLPAAVPADASSEAGVAVCNAPVTFAENDESRIDSLQETVLDIAPRTSTRCPAGLVKESSPGFVVKTDTLMLATSETRHVSSNQVFTSANKDTNHDDVLAQSVKDHSMHDKPLSHDEWNRFLTSDPTVLGTLYKSLEFHWIYLSPIILLWKVVLICPAVFLPAETFEQMVGLCVTEVGFALFISLTAPFISPMVDMMYRVGSIHQLLFLAFRCLDSADRFEGGAGFGTALVALTFVYLLFSVGCVVWTVVGPQVQKAVDNARTIDALQELGYQYSLATSLYLVPSSDAIRKTEREQDSAGCDAS